MNAVRVLIIAYCVLVLGCTDTADDGEAEDAASPESAMQNPLLDEWSGPYGGVPAFDRMDLAHLKPALERAMELALA
jgi:peptidyl-dipeptidase Dcp